MKKRHQHITKILAILLLGVFSIALTPWSALHHHVEENHFCRNEINCMHKLHLSTSGDHCLICAAHFEKTFVTNHDQYRVFFNTKILSVIQTTLSGSYTELIGTSLRGPPLYRSLTA